MLLWCCELFFCKQMPVYERPIRDWGPDLCSSNLPPRLGLPLGSFPTEGQAKTAWTRVSKRFAYLAPLGQSIEKATVNGNTVYRLRVNAGSADQAKSVCGKLKVAGEACFIPRD